MPSMKVTQLSIDEVNQAIMDAKLEDIWVLTLEHSKLYRLIDIQMGTVIRHMRKGSAFIRLEITEDDRTEK